MNVVLHTIREILKFKDYTTIAEIASTAGLPRKHVLETINRNGEFVSRNRKNGRITQVDPRSKLRDELWKSGKFYRQGSYGAWSHEGYELKFEGHVDLKEKLQRSHTTGGIGDSWTIQIIPDTPLNRAALEEAGLRPWEEAVIDDQLWLEEPAEGAKT